MNERLKDDKFTKQDKKTSNKVPYISNVENALDREIPSNIQEILTKNKKHILENVHEFNSLFSKNDSIKEKLKKTLCKTKETNTKKINFKNSQKTRKQKTRKQKKEKKDILKKFDDNVTFLQENDENDIKLDMDDIADISNFNERSKNQSKEQRYEKIYLTEVIKMLNDAINEREVLLHQNSIYSVLNLEKNMKKIRLLTKQFQECYHKYAANDKLLNRYENFEKSRLEESILELEGKARSIINDFHFETNKLQATITMFTSELNNIKNQKAKHDKCEINRDDVVIRNTEELEKKTISEKKHYEKSQKVTSMTTEDQSITLKITDFKKKSLQFKDNIVHVASKMAICIKTIAVSIFDKFKVEEQLFGKKSVQYDNDNTSTSKTNKKSPNSIEAPITKIEIFDNIFDMIKTLLNFKGPNNNFQKHSTRKISFQNLEEKLNKLDNKKCKRELIKQLENTNTDNILNDLKQVEDKVGVEPKNKENINANSKSICECPSCTKCESFKSTKFLISLLFKEFNLMRTKIENLDQHYCGIKTKDACHCAISEKILTGIEN